MSSSASSSITTWNLPGGNASETVAGSIININPTATTVFLTCPDRDDVDQFIYCNMYNMTMTIGPWAQMTPPPDASTGLVAYVQTATFPNSWWATPYTQMSSIDWITGVYHGHCDVTSATVVTSCTYSANVSVYVPNATITELSPAPSTWGIAAQAVTITAGLEKLSSATMSASASVAASGSASGPPVRSTASSAGATSTSASAVATASHTAAAFVYGLNPSTLSLIGLVTAFLLR
ncbi:hypothetical protein ANO11243_050920 [Dothideomycetidae sp. 11243]|nr:hypothetical protein ANO11243_050920 [fungal sp. No.11243]